MQLYFGLDQFIQICLCWYYCLLFFLSSRFSIRQIKCIWLAFGIYCCYAIMIIVVVVAHFPILSMWILNVFSCNFVMRDRVRVCVRVWCVVLPIKFLRIVRWFETIRFDSIQFNSIQFNLKSVDCTLRISGVFSVSVCVCVRAKINNNKSNIDEINVQCKCDGQKTAEAETATTITTLITSKRFMMKGKTAYSTPQNSACVCL